MLGGGAGVARAEMYPSFEASAQLELFRVAGVGVAAAWIQVHPLL